MLKTPPNPLKEAELAALPLKEGKFIQDIIC